jgi:hypothetical protein
MRVDWMLSPSHPGCWPTNAAQFLQHILPLSAPLCFNSSLAFPLSLFVCGFRLPSGGRGTKAGILTRPVEVSPEHLNRLEAAVKARGHRGVVQALQTCLKVIPGVGVWAVVAPANKRELCREAQAGRARLQPAQLCKSLQARWWHLGSHCQREQKATVHSPFPLNCNL